MKVLPMSNRNIFDDHFFVLQGSPIGRRLITFVAIAISKTSSSNSSCLAKT